MDAIGIDPELAEGSLYYFSAVVLVLLSIGAWFLSLVTLPGNWIIVACCALFAWLFPEEGGRGISWLTVIVLTVLAGLGEVIEFVAGAAGAAKQGASRRSVALSILGAILGSVVGLSLGVPVLVVGPFIGAVLGGAVGAFGGAYLGEYWKGRSEEERMAASQGAFFGRIWGTVGKLATGAVMLAIVAWDALL